MDYLFGDATVMPTPATQEEHESVMGTASPVSSLDIRRQYGADNVNSVLEVDPPNIKSGSNFESVSSSSQNNGRNEGIGGWLRNMGTQHRGPSRGTHSQYQRLDQIEDGEHYQE